MYAWFYRGSDYLQLPLIGMFIFITVFVLVLGRLFLSRSERARLEVVSYLPLDSDEHPVLSQSAQPR